MVPGCWGSALVLLWYGGAAAGPTAFLSTGAKLRKGIPITADTPDSPLNVMKSNYEVAQPTPEAAILDGMYCRGGGCQYRTGAPPPLVSPTPPVPIIYPQSNRDFCKGFSCTAGMAVPESPAMNKFNFDCGHLYNDVGKLHGKNGERSISDAKESFFSWCKTRVAPPLWGNCNGLGDVLVMAMSSRANSANVGGAKEFCSDTFLFLGMMNQAKVDLKLLPGAFPKPAALLSYSSIRKLILPSNLDAEVGPYTRRGQAWLQFLKKERRPYAASGRSLYDRSAWSADSGARPVFLQHHPNGTSFLSTKLDPPYTPDYTQAAPCVHGVYKGAYKYTIDQNIPPTEIDGHLYEFCSNEMAEIMAGFAQTGEMTISMTKDWCNWQSSVTSWVGEADQTGRPEWDFRRCNGMASLLAFALHNDLSAGLGASDVCNKLFLSFGAFDWHQKQVDTAWALGPARVIKDVGLSSSVDEDAAKKLMEQAAKYAATLQNKLSGQKEMYNDLNGAKMDSAAFSLNHKKRETGIVMKPKPLPPPLPKMDTFSELDF